MSNATFGSTNMLLSPRRQMLGGLTALAVSIPVLAMAADEVPAATPVTMVVEFTIKAYDTWRAVFDAAEAERVDAGVTGPRVFREADRPDQILVLFTVASRNQGAAWMRSAKVREAWRKGGVIGDPAYRFIRKGASAGWGRR